ncbi:somatostatin receptor type 2-like [Orussus abietinus]|uniref:somatostatin receptor type 2-like n=1 Tax=Orussus abietinus TaxID=222816 RepID=UPI0006261933|nr:somatostatin receptor type 2-like [Orussus abietinus]XP_012275003.1 somatostatin receptor type 2-like [Orussus abietinus]
MNGTDVVSVEISRNVSQNDSIVLNCDAHLPVVSLVTQVLYSIVCIVGLLGNSLVIYVVLRFSKMQTVTNIYILNLAIADECFLFGIPFLVTTMSHSWIFGEVMCKVYMTTTSVNQFTSSIFLFIMSADRYIAVCHPISSPKMRTPFISKMVSLTAWGTSALFMIPVFLYANAMPDRNGTVSCNIYWPNSGGNETAGDDPDADPDGQTSFILYTFVLGFAIPLVLILVFYTLVIRKLQTVGPKNKSKEKKRSHRKVTKLVLTVITVYVLCWLPYWVMQVALTYTPPKKCQSRISITGFLLSGFLSYSNSAMNPILYAFLSDNFKKSFLKACTCAGGKDVNATLHVENSVFPRRTKAHADRAQGHRGPSRRSGDDADDEEAERGLLSSKTSTTAITKAAAITATDSQEQPYRGGKDAFKNGLTMLTQV